jgi:hypothetical protein
MSCGKIMSDEVKHFCFSKDEIENEKIVILLNKKKMTLLLVGGIVFVIAGIWIISSPIKVYQVAYLLFEGIIAEIARHILFWVGGVAGVIFFLALLAFYT